MSKPNPCVSETLPADVYSHERKMDVGISASGFDEAINAALNAFHPMPE